MPPTRKPRRALRLARAGLAAALAVGTLTACADTVDGSGQSSGASESSGRTADGSAQLSAHISAGMKSVVSTHLLQTIGVSGVKITAEGDETLAAGVVTGFRIASSLLGVKVVMLLAGGQGYAQVPQLSTTAKPWVKVTSDSTNATVHSLYAQIETIRNGTSDEALAGFADAATRIDVGGRSTIEGSQVTAYRLTIDVDKLPDTTNKTTLQQQGITTLDVTLYLDAQFRVVRLQQNGNYRGTQYDVEMTLSDFDQAVNIAAPPAAQVQVR